MVFKFIALMFMLHLVVSLPNNETDAEKKMDVKVDRNESILLPDNSPYIEKKMDKKTDRNEVWKRKNGTSLPKSGHQIWSKTVKACLVGMNDRSLVTSTFEDCKQACVDETTFECQSVDYYPPQQDCQLSTSRSTSYAYEEPCYGGYAAANIFAEIIHASCKDIGGICMSDYKIMKNKCKGKANTNFLCNAPRPNCCIERCPEEKGFFRLPHPSNQCFKLFVEKPSNWEDANIACYNAGLVLAKPLETITLKNYLVLRYGDLSYLNTGVIHSVTAWLDAKTDGICMKWNRGPYGCISPDIPIWWPGQPVVTKGRCLLLTSNSHDWKIHPDKSLYALPCDWLGRPPLCELLM